MYNAMNIGLLEVSDCRGETYPQIKNSQTWQLFADNALLAATYWTVGVAMRWYFARYGMWPPPLWLPAGISMSAVLLIGWGAVPGIFFASLLTETLSFHSSLPNGLWIAAGNAIAPLVAVAVLKGSLDMQNPFRRVRDVFLFAVLCILTGVISAMIGGTETWITSSVPFSSWSDLILEWTISDGAGALLIVPLVILLRRYPPMLDRIQKHAVEFLFTITAAVAAIGYLLTQDRGALPSGAGVAYLLVLPLLWAAVRFSSHVAYPMFLAAMAVVVAATLAGYGPYGGMSRSETLLLFSQMAIGCGAAVLLLGAAAEQQRDAEEDLRKLNQELERRVEDRTAKLRQSQAQLEKAAFHDLLTGLPNRRFFEDRFAAARASAERNGSKFTFLLIDLDRFKQVNDTLGHDAGDTLLVQTAQRLSRSVREYDFVARLGGDEFCVLLPETSDPAAIEDICARIVANLNDRIIFDDKTITTSPSIGIACLPADGAQWHDLYKSADVALYRAKQAGRNRWAWCHETEARSSARS